MEFEVKTYADPERLHEELSQIGINFIDAIKDITDNNLQANKILGRKADITIDIKEVSTDSNDIRYKLRIISKGVTPSLEDLKERIFRPGEHGLIRGANNNHGMGLNQSLAFLTDKNKNEFIYCTCKDKRNVLIIKGPFSDKTSGKSVNWKGSAFEEYKLAEGVIIELILPFTIIKTMDGRFNDFSKLMEAFYEDLLITYKEEIKNKHKVRLVYKEKDKKEVKKELFALEPLFSDLTCKGEIIVNHNNKDIKIGFKGGYVHPKYIQDIQTKHNICLNNLFVKTFPAQNIFIYRKGCRLIEKVFSEIAGKQKHNLFNGFFGEVILPAEESLFPTNTHKTGFLRTELFKKVMDELKTQLIVRPEKKEFRNKEPKANNVSTMIENSGDKKEKYDQGVKEVQIDVEELIKNQHKNLCINYDIKRAATLWKKGLSNRDHVDIMVTVINKKKSATVYGYEVKGPYEKLNTEHVGQALKEWIGLVSKNNMSPEYIGICVYNTDIKIIKILEQEINNKIKDQLGNKIYIKIFKIESNRIKALN